MLIGRLFCLISLLISVPQFAFSIERESAAFFQRKRVEFITKLDACASSNEVQALLEFVRKECSVYYQQKGVSPDVRIDLGIEQNRLDSILEVLASRRKEKLFQQQVCSLSTHELETILASQCATESYPAAVVFFERMTGNRKNCSILLLDTLSRHKNKYVRALVADSMREEKSLDRIAKEVLVRLLMDSSEEVRCNSVSTISARPFPEAFSYVLLALDDPFVPLKANAAGALGRFGLVGISGLPQLFQIAQNKNDFAYSNAMSSIQSLLSLVYRVSFTGSLPIPSISLKGGFAVRK